MACASRVWSTSLSAWANWSRMSPSICPVTSTRLGAEAVDRVHCLEGRVELRLDLLDAPHRVAAELGGRVHTLVERGAGLADQVLVALTPCGIAITRIRLPAVATGAQPLIRSRPVFSSPCGAQRLLGVDVGEVLARAEQLPLPQRLGRVRAGRFERLDVLVRAPVEPGREMRRVAGPCWSRTHGRALVSSCARKGRAGRRPGAEGTAGPQPRDFSSRMTSSRRSKRSSTLSAFFRWACPSASRPCSSSALPMQ